jgi:hypothetical protein
MIIYIYIINNLHVYASLLGHKNCTSLITQLSGGGQLFSHFGNKNIKILNYFIILINIKIITMIF